MTAKTKKIERTLEGKVIKLSSQNTIKVKIESKYPHPKYGKIIKSHKSYLVHDEGNLGDVEVGDSVIIKESRPISKNKKWTLVKINKA